MIYKIFTLAALLQLLQTCLMAQVLHVGPGQTYPNLALAANAVQPGDTILIHTGIYPGGVFLSNLQGTANQWITIKNAPGESPVFEGGNNAIQLSDPAYLHFSGLTFQHQTGNGFNTDDGGTYDSPAHHIVFEACVFRDISVTGNNDLLKLSGLDSFEIRNCQFLNGSPNGSGVDLVGCHHGVIKNNYFENLGSNSIQAKGGTAWIRIEGNMFKDGGQRALNLGGSTGLQFFRPDTARYEAAHLQVYSNLFIGSWAPIAYVGSVDVQVVNNTFYKPENWVIRILQETVDPDRFLECGDNSFINNIIYLDKNLNTETNIGSNTRPETFLFSHNLWYNSALPNWSGPDIPTPDPNQLVNADPLFTNADDEDFSLLAGSLAIGSGLAVAAPMLDYEGNAFLSPRSRGAVESGLSSTDDPTQTDALWVFPNPFAEELFLVLDTETGHTRLQISLHDAMGSRVYEGHSSNGRLYLPKLPAGTYLLRVQDLKEGKIWWKKLLKQ
jgi:hypothetical protein